MLKYEVLGAALLVSDASRMWSRGPNPIGAGFAHLEELLLVGITCLDGIVDRLKQCPSGEWLLGIGDYKRDVQLIVRIKTLPSSSRAGIAG